MKRNKRGPRSTAAVALLLAAVALPVWLVSMYCFTAVAAEFAATQALADNGRRAGWIADTWLREDWLNMEGRPANYRESLFWQAVSEGTVGFGTPYAEGGDWFLEWGASGEAYAATAVYDAAGNCIEKSWDDFFYFQYMSEEQWAANADRQYDNARAFFDRERLTEAGRALLERRSLNFDAAAMRFTGAFDGVEFTPSRIDYIYEGDFRNALAQRGDGRYTVSEIVNRYAVPWVTIYDVPEAVPAGTETVTLYADWAKACFAPDSPSFSYQGKNYGGIAALLEEVGPTLAAEFRDLSRHEGLDLLIFDVSYRETYEGEAYDLEYHFGGEAYEGGAPELQFYVVSAVYCSPWRAAMAGLCHVYILTFLLAAALALIACRLIRRQLIRPARLVGEALAEGRDRLGQGPRELWRWREGRLLEAGFTENADLLKKQKNEITRLNTALEYAEAAEENRRRMTSGIAHQLKTPLAVIHSYAEGLKERIAEEKREKYLDVILSEAERTDGLVLEMLDLSRLEAGKVKLSRDEFSLTELTRTVLEKLELAARAKDLRVELDCPGPCVVAADEGRVGQVIENLAVNAVKYTPAGGRVSVRVRADRFGTAFLIENQCEPLPDEALERVWEPFYRADETRAGTGLGLAVAKRIVELHGGKCAVRNTDGGVEFRFTLF